MRMASLRKRLRAGRPMTTMSMRMPVDVIADLKRVAPLLGFTGYQPLIRAYIGQGLRNDLARLERVPDMSVLLRQLRRQGVSERVISLALAESKVARRTA